ncbi:MAG TPA: 30S ribosomal protein S27ae [Candidatus Thermoplasmatota archaeon]|nr:30S ribosomal protein S27ae [Candidatus Thermoplasmatota archaeon]
MPEASKFYQIQDGKLVRTHRTCPKCGPGVFMANHEDRNNCGKCGHTEFSKQG